MRLEQLKDEYPVMPEDIRRRIEQEVHVQMKTDNGKYQERKRTGRMSGRKAVVAALAATMAIGTTVFAGAKLYEWKVEKVGNYAVSAGIAADGSEELKVPEEIPVLSVKAGYLPKGMVAADDESGKYYYEQTPYQGGISIAFITMDEKLSADNLPVSDGYVTSAETLSINGLNAVYLEKQAAMNKKIYVAYPQYWKILEVFIGEDVSKEEAIKVIENLRVQPTGETTLLSEAYTWSDMLNEEEEAKKEAGEKGIELKRTASGEEMKNLHRIGEEFQAALFASTDTKEWAEQDCINVKVADVQVKDDLSLLNTEYTDKSLTKALGTDGKLVKNEIQYIESGDGVNTLDQNVKTEEVNQKLVYTTLEFTNNGKEELRDVMFLGIFMGLDKDGENYSIYDRAQADQDEKTDSITCSSMGGFGEMDYYDVRGGERNNNYIPSIKPGETVTVHLAKVVNEDELDKMYLVLDGEGNRLEFSENALKAGYVDIRQ